MLNVVVDSTVVVEEVVWLSVINFRLRSLQQAEVQHIFALITTGISIINDEAWHTENYNSKLAFLRGFYTSFVPEETERVISCVLLL